MPHQKIIAYTDGGARGNPGIAGSGAYITYADGHVIKEAHRSLGVKTNNFAEYEAVILALEEIKKFFGKEKLVELDIEVRMDSELVQRQLTGQYRVKDKGLQQQFIKLNNLKSEFPHVNFVHVRREDNKDADRLSNVAMNLQEK
ncbi:MAG TPA: ribonuclease HI family protein [Candidatus Paceibacterota bacterium]|nr:ribonuclease HI family protein [Candidatus Paceibacterota bacterium]